MHNKSKKKDAKKLNRVFSHPLSAVLSTEPIIILADDKQLFKNAKNIRNPIPF